MKRMTMLLAGMFVTGLAYGDDVSGIDRMLCSAATVKICFETGECFDALPEDLEVPQFVILDVKKNSVSTTRASKTMRSSQFSRVQRDGGLVRMQGFEGERAYSFVIDEATGTLTVAVSADGFTVAVFGACTDANVK